GVAPMGLILTATATSPAARVDIPFHDIEYVWSFDDPGTFDALDNAPIWGNDRNVAYGPVTAHVFSQPGTYLVTCTAHDGESAPRSETIEILVESASDVFAGSKTAVVSTASNFAGAPSGAQQFNSINAALNVMEGNQDYRILLRRGETYTDDLFVDETSGSGKRILLGAFGTGANPLLDMSASGSYGVSWDVENGVADELMVRDIDVLGEYDPTLTGQAANNAGGGVDYRSKSLLTHKTIWGCHFKNSGNETINISTNDNMKNVYVGNSWFDGWRNYGALVSDGGDVAFVGTKIKQPTGTRNANGKNNDWADHGPFRLSRPTGPTVFVNTDLTSFNDWSSATSNYSLQPVIRWHGGDGASPIDAVLVIDRMRAEGGPINLQNTATGTIKRDVFALADRVYSIYSSQQAAGIIHGGSVYRNGVFVVPDVPSGGSTGIRDGSVIEDSAPAGGRRTEIYSCAIIDLRDNNNSTNRSGASGPRDFAFPQTTTNDGYTGNLVGYCPNRTGGTQGYSADNPLETSDGAWDPIYGGEIYGAGSPVAGTTYGRECTATFKPLAGSDAIGSASGKVSLLDFEGNLRSEILAGLSRNTPSKGPYEPDLES
ncbi:MAG: hypothetical protein AAGJ39_05325, partial [Pseudomonadota bacterium]